MSTELARGFWKFERLDAGHVRQRATLFVAQGRNLGAMLDDELGPTPLDLGRAAILVEEWRGMVQAQPGRYRLTEPGP